MKSLWDENMSMGEIVQISSKININCSENNEELAEGVIRNNLKD